MSFMGSGMCAAKWCLFLRILRVLWKKNLNLYRAADTPDDGWLPAYGPRLCEGARLWRHHRARRCSRTFHVLRPQPRTLYGVPLPLMQGYWCGTQALNGEHVGDLADVELRNRS